MQINQAVILSGGQGERLRPFTKKTNKVMYPVGDKTFLWYLVKLLKDNGINKILILTGWKAETIKFDGVEFSYLPYPKKSTLRLKKALPLLEDTFLLLYNDNWWPLDLKEYESLLYYYKDVIETRYKGKNIGFFIVNKKVIEKMPKVDKPVEHYLMKRANAVFNSSKPYLSISDPERAEKTANALQSM